MITFKSFLSEKKHIHPHVLDPNVALKHQTSKKHTMVDLDVDGDVDAMDKMTPDEISVPTKTSTSKMFKKYDREKTHTKVGVAYR